jgi:hypothetical protein
VADPRVKRSPQGKPRFRHVAGSQRGKTPGTPRPRWTRRLRTWVITAIVAGLGLGITGLVSRGVDSGANAVKQFVLPPSSTSASNAGGLGSGRTVEDKTLSSDGLTIFTTVKQGLGCDGRGDVYPVSLTPGLSLAVPPGSGPTHGGKTWDKSPRAFGAVPAGPVEIGITLTGPTNHAVTITDLRFHVISRKPQVNGPWLNSAEGCGAGGNYHYGVVDFDTPAPYWLPTSALPEFYRTDVLKFPYTTCVIHNPM